MGCCLVHVGVSGEDASSMSTLYLLLVSGSDGWSAFVVVSNFLRFILPIYCHSLGFSDCYSSNDSFEEDKSGRLCLFCIPSDGKGVVFAMSAIVWERTLYRVSFEWWAVCRFGGCAYEAD